MAETHDHAPSKPTVADLVRQLYAPEADRAKACVARFIDGQQQRVSEASEWYSLLEEEYDGADSTRQGELYEGLVTAGATVEHESGALQYLRDELQAIEAEQGDAARVQAYARDQTQYLRAEIATRRLDQVS